MAKIKRRRFCSGKWLTVLGYSLSPWLFGLSLLFATSSQAQVSEPQLRAGVIIGVLRFTSWTTPPVASTLAANTSTVNTSATSTPTTNTPTASTLLVCGVGNSAGFGVLQRAETKIVISGRALAFKAIDKVNDSNGCAVLIVGAKAGGVRAGSSKPLSILSICDGCDQPDQHAVAVFMNNQRVQFSVDMALAQSAGVQFSSNMLELAARVVHR